MKKRILSLVLALAMLVPAVAVSVSAVPYTPSVNGYKDFGQENYYLYEVTKGNAAPKADGRITDADGYGDPISTYGYRYMTTADKVAFDFDKGEYVMTSSGDYYVYPTQDSAPEVWDSITNFENDSPYSYIYSYYVRATKFSSSSTYYYVHPVTGAYVRAYGVTKATFKEYRPMNSSLYYTLENAKLLTEEPADWAKNYKNYYTKPSSTGYKYVEGDTAPAWEADKYYTGEFFTVPYLHTRSSSGAASVATVTSMKNARVILPEEVKLYARYDDKYLYYAIQLKEMQHKKVRYSMDNSYGSTITNAPVHFYNNVSFIDSYRMAPDSTTPVATASASLTTYINAKQTLKSEYFPAILAKFGNPDALALEEVQTAGVDFNITHTPFTPSAEPEETPDEGGFGEEDSTDYSSQKYGYTVYEYRVPWAVINREYSPNEDASAILDVFTILTNIDLENDIGPGAMYFALSFPRAAYRLPGSIYTTTGPYPNDVHVLRTVSATGMEPGTYNFYWRNIFNSGDVMWNSEYFTSDYFTVSDKKSGSLSQFPPIFYTLGQEPAEGYVKPGYEGTAIRVDGSDAQQMRIKISIPETEKEIEQAGVLLAPTEVSRRGHLKLGMSAIAYYAEEYPVFYGIVGDEWVNMTENTEAYFSASATPNDSDSYATHDLLGGKPTGIYSVYTLNVDLDDPYGQVTDEETDVTSDVYTTIFTGPNGEGIYDDYDDFFTFYTIRPYIKYTDGTVVYGDYEYKSIYYLACWMFRDMLFAYNETVIDSATVTDRFNMDMMPLTTVKDKDGNVVTDIDGNNIYIPKTNTALKTDSAFAGGAERSIYWPERRLELFRWYANRTVSRANGGVSIRIEDYDTYHPDVKALVDKYVELYENVWQQLVKCEQKRYFTLAK